MTKFVNFVKAKFVIQKKLFYFTKSQVGIKFDICLYKKY